MKNASKARFNPETGFFFLICKSLKTKCFTKKIENF